MYIMAYILYIYIFPKTLCVLHTSLYKIIFDILQEGKELGRVPAIHNGKVQKFFFNEEAIVTAFDLNNVYKKCKEDKKFVPFEDKETKKDK